MKKLMLFLLLLSPFIVSGQELISIFDSRSSSNTGLISIFDSKSGVNTNLNVIRTPGYTHVDRYTIDTRRNSNPYNNISTYTPIDVSKSILPINRVNCSPVEQTPRTKSIPINIEDFMGTTSMDTKKTLKVLFPDNK